MNDIDINNEFGKFKLRVSAILIKNGKILVHEGKKFKGFCFPGGHVELGETTSEAIKREMQEELNIEVNIADIFCINENIYTNNLNTVCQEINYYYKVELLFDVLSDEPFEIIELDKGIEKKHIPRLFERFYRIDKTGARAHGGSGLGLSIVDKAIQHLGGELSLSRSEELGGLSVLVKIPIQCNIKTEK